jgi:hypothetical protein
LKNKVLQLFPNDNRRNISQKTKKLFYFYTFKK